MFMLCDFVDIVCAKLYTRRCYCMCGNGSNMCRQITIRSEIMTNIVQLLGDEAEHLLKYRCTGIPKESLHLPGPDYVDRVVAMKDRKPGVLRSLQALYGHGRLANSGYLSLLPVDQGVEHSAGASFAPNPCLLYTSDAADDLLCVDL